MNQQASILITDDDLAHRTMLKANLVKAGYRIIEAEDGDEVEAILAAQPIDLLLLDLKMERVQGMETLALLQERNCQVPIIIITAFSSVESAVQAMKQGAFDYITKPIDIEELKLMITRALGYEELKNENRNLKEQLQEQFTLTKIIGSSSVMQELYQTISLVAKSDATILITGESGTGKELVASALFENSLRKDNAFIKINCATLHENLLESELFGHQKGAFTGALEQRRGRFELAHKGTLFLDEIGDMTLATQAKVLRVLQEGEFERLGASQPIHVDVRIIAATNRDLAAMVAEGTFRQDLFFRLNVVPVVLPPLKQRSGDIPDLARFFLKRYREKNRKDIKGIHPQALNLLMRYDWPGNIRELENCIERAVVLCLGEEITPRELPPQITPMEILPQKTQKQAPTGSGPTLRDMEREMIWNTLEETGHNKSKTAKILGIARQTLLNKIKEYSLFQS